MGPEEYFPAAEVTFVQVVPPSVVCDTRIRAAKSVFREIIHSRVRGTVIAG